MEKCKSFVVHMEGNMKKTSLFLIATIMLIVFAGCQPKHAGDFVSGPADMAPPHFATEQELVEHLRSMDGDIKTDCYYRLNTVPVDMKFDSYSSYFSYVDWWFNDPAIREETRFIYLRWFFSDNGRELLENDLKENGAGRTELQVGERTFYYLLVDEPDIGWPKLYDIEWLHDGYLFCMNIPEKYITTTGNLDESLLLKYTELNRILIDPPSPSQSQQQLGNEAVDTSKQEIIVDSSSSESSSSTPSGYSSKSSQVASSEYPSSSTPAKADDPATVDSSENVVVAPSSQSSKAVSNDDNYERLREAVSKFMSEQYGDYKIMALNVGGNPRYSHIDIELQNGVDFETILEIAQNLSYKFGGEKEYIQSYVDTIQVISGEDGICLVID